MRSRPTSLLCSRLNDTLILPFKRDNSWYMAAMSSDDGLIVFSPMPKPTRAHRGRRLCSSFQTSPNVGGWARTGLDDPTVYLPTESLCVQTPGLCAARWDGRWIVPPGRRATVWKQQTWNRSCNTSPGAIRVHNADFFSRSLEKEKKGEVQKKKLRLFLLCCQSLFGSKQKWGKRRWAFFFWETPPASRSWWSMVKNESHVTDWIRCSGFSVRSTHPP